MMLRSILRKPTGKSPNWRSRSLPSVQSSSTRFTRASAQRWRTRCLTRLKEAFAYSKSTGYFCSGCSGSPASRRRVTLRKREAVLDCLLTMGIHGSSLGSNHALAGRSTIGRASDRRGGVKMQRSRRMIGYEIPEEIAADCLFEAQGNVAEAQRLARRHIVGDDDYWHVAQLIEAAAERVV